MAVVEEPAAEGAARREAGLALKNGALLSLSLLATVVIGMAVRFWVPRVLGPSAYGQLHFAESLALLCFLLTTLGIDIFLRKEAATDLRSAEPYFGGLLVFRAVLSVAVLGLMGLTLWLMGKGAVEVRLCLLFAGWQAAVVLNGSLEALLHAGGKVGVLVFVSPAVKVLWALGLVAGLLSFARPEVVALSYLLAEALKAGLLLLILKKQMGFRFRVDLSAAWAVVVASAGYFVNYLAHRLTERIDVQMLSVMVDDREVGLYGAAANLALMGLLFLPIVNAVVLPMGARIAASSNDAMNETMRATVRLFVAFGGLPTGLLLLHAEAVVALLFGPAFAPAVPSVQILAVLFPLTYIAVVSSLHLIQLGQIWTVTKASFVGLAMNPALNLALIPLGVERLGPGGGGAAAALATILTEIVVVVLFLRALGRAGVDRRLFFTLFATLCLLAACALVHRALSPLGLFSVPFEVLTYLLGGTLLGVIPARTLLRFLLEELRRRRGASSSP